MKRRIIIRQTKSKPPTPEELGKLFRDVYQPNQKVNHSSQAKIVIKSSGSIYILKKREAE